MSLTLLAPTDFSRAARNAINYASQMARRMQAKLILFHAYPPPVAVSEVPLVIPFPAGSEAYIQKKLKRLKQDLLSKRGNKNLDIETDYVCGIPVDEIYLYGLKRKIDFVVMGMQGKGFLKEKLIGSATTSLIQKCKVPVLSIDRKVKFKSVKKVVFAADNKSLEQHSLNPLSKISSAYGSHIYVLNVITSPTSLPGISTIRDKNISKVFRNFDHSVHQITNITITGGLSAFIAAKHMDMIVMIPHQHSLVDRIMAGRQSKEMAFHSTIPLLTLP